MEKESVIGIVGGMGPMAGVLLQKYIYTYDKSERDQGHVKSIAINDTKIPDRTEYILKKSGDSPLARLIEDVYVLTTLKVGVIAIPSNTSMFFIDELRRQTPIEILDIAEESVRAAKEKGVAKVLVLTTDGARETKVYQGRCDKYGIKYVMPGDENQRIVNDVIRGVVLGTRGNEDRLVEVIRESDCDGVIVGSTELSFVRDELVYDGVLVDSLKVLAERAVDRAKAV